MELKRFAYSLVRYVPDVVRGEIVNLGVVVISEEDGQAGSRFLPRVRQRIGLLDPNADAEFVQELVDGIARRFTGTYQPTLGETQSEPITTAAALSQLGSVLRNQIQLGPPARYRGASLDQALDHLFGTLVAPVAKRKEPAERHMTVGRIRDLIREAIKQWSSDAVQVEEATTEKVGGVTHRADFWLSMGSPTAALLAIPNDPEEYDIAWFRRDSLPTVAREFRTINPRFKAVAVFPPQVDEDAQFISETKSLLRGEEGVIVTSVDALPGLREQLIPQLV